MIVYLPSSFADPTHIYFSRSHIYFSRPTTSWLLIRFLFVHREMFKSSTSFTLCESRMASTVEVPEISVSKNLDAARIYYF